jgi:hypothetical protein
MTAPNHNLLIELMLADELSPEQQHQLRDLISSEAHVEEEVFDQMWLEPLLRDSFASDSDAFVKRIEAALDSDDNETAQFTERVLDVWTDRSAQRTRTRFVSWAAGIAVVAAIMLVVVFNPPGGGSTVQAAPAVRIQNAIGTVEVIGADGKTRPAAFGTVIEPGDTLKTSGESSATISCADESRIVLTRDASLTWPTDESEKVVLNSGLAHVSSAAQAASLSDSMIFSTQHATIEVPNSEFLLATSNRQTDVTVRRGTAKLTGSDGKSIDIVDGECGIAKNQSLRLRKGTATPDDWSEGFESGVSSDWQGHFIDKGLPEGSRGAIGTAPSVNEDGEPCHQIWTYSDWQHGLAVVHEDTCLNFVYRFKTADRVQVMTLLRSPVPDSPIHDVQILQPSDVPSGGQWWNIPAGEWYTVSIPLSRLSNPVSREHPTESSIATAFNFRPQNHACGLVIDRMWLERGTSQKIESIPLK